MSKDRVVVVVKGGVASLAFKPRGVEVEIIDEDEKSVYPENEVWIEGVKHED